MGCFNVDMRCFNVVWGALMGYGVFKYGMGCFIVVMGCFNMVWGVLMWYGVF